MRILAVDDDENIRELLEASIAAETPHELTTASSAIEALRHVGHGHEPFDCFLLDIQMPEMDGITLCRKLRDLPEYKTAPVLMLTAMAQKKFVDRAFKAGATDYVTKPFEFLELFSRLDNAERLIMERRRLEESHSEIDALKRDLARSAAHSLSEPVELTGIERMVGYVSFENYLLQLSRMKLAWSSVFAIKIANVEKVFDGLSRGAFRQLLSEIGTQLAQEMPEMDDLVTYRGNGVFMGTLSQRRGFSQHELEQALNRRVRELAALRSAGLHAKVCVGEPVSMLSLTRIGALSALQTAIGKAEARADNFREVQNHRDRLKRIPSAKVSRAEQERRVYESLLRDTLTDEAPMAPLNGESGKARLRNLG